MPFWRLHTYLLPLSCVQLKYIIKRYFGSILAFSHKKNAYKNILCIHGHCILGVTTVIDGGSAGSMTFQGLKKFICENSKTRVLAFLNIACHGLAGAGCSGSDFGPGENDMQK